MEKEVSVEEVGKGKGYDWDVYEREQFAGAKLTAENKREYRKAFINKYIDNFEFKVKEGTITEEQLIKEAESYAQEHIAFHQKMERAHLKGKMFFTWRGKRERVWTTSYLSRMQSYMRELEKAHVESAANTKDTAGEEE